MQSTTIANVVEILRDLIYKEIEDMLLKEPNNRREIDVCIGRYDEEVGFIESNFTSIYIDSDNGPILLQYDNGKEESLCLLSIDEMLQLLTIL